MSTDNTQHAFFELVRGGLWERDIHLKQYGNVDYNALNQLAEEQSVIGLVTSGLEHVKDVIVPKEWTLQFIGATLQIEQRNKEMNKFVAQLTDYLRKENIYTLLLKGQGIAQCYERPLWRTSGDVDLFLSEENYTRAKKVLTNLASDVEEEDTYYKHLGMTIDSWEVELHGNLRGGLSKRIDRGLDNIARDVVCGSDVRSWMNGNSQTFMMGIEEDVVYVFTHMLQHYFHEGVGLRQICDWCRLLWTYREKINISQLRVRLKELGLMSEWQAFATMAVDYLGMPAVAMPFHSESDKWKRKATRLIEFVIETGNFGHNRDYSYLSNKPYLIRKAISFGRHTKDSWKYFSIFPLDSVMIWWNMIIRGVTAVCKTEGKL